jgi:DNA-directed RNA polymerase subunit RPC12/RpoP
MTTKYNCPECGKTMRMSIKESADDDPQEIIYLDCPDIDECGFRQTSVRDKSNHLVLIVIEDANF